MNPYQQAQHHQSQLIICVWDVAGLNTCLVDWDIFCLVFLRTIVHGNTCILKLLEQKLQ